MGCILNDHFRTFQLKDISPNLFLFLVLPISVCILNTALVTVIALDMCMTPNQSQGVNESFFKNPRIESFFFFPFFFFYGHTCSRWMFRGQELNLSYSSTAVALLDSLTPVQAED